MPDIIDLLKVISEYEKHRTEDITKKTEIHLAQRMALLLLIRTTPKENLHLFSGAYVGVLKQGLTMFDAHLNYCYEYEPDNKEHIELLKKYRDIYQKDIDKFEKEGCIDYVETFLNMRQSEEWSRMDDLLRENIKRPKKDEEE